MGMRNGTSAGLDQLAVGTALSSLRSTSGLVGRRTPKRNARKRIILQEKISRELSASRTRVNDSQANVHRCVSLAAALQEQLIDISHRLREALHTESGRDSPSVLSDLVDQLCQVQLLHHAVQHSLELLQNAADKLLQAERATHVLESNTCSSPGAEAAAKIPASAPPPAVVANYGHLDAGAFFSAAADAPLPTSNAPDSSPYSAPRLSQHTLSQAVNVHNQHASVVQSPNGARPSPIAARMSSCSTVTDVDTSRMSQPLPAALAVDPARGDGDETDFFSRSCSAQIHTHWGASASGACASPWLSCALEPAPSAPSPSVWQMTDAEKLHAQRAMFRTRTTGAGAFMEDSPALQACDAPPAGPPAHITNPTPTDAQLYAERSLSAPLRHASNTAFERVHSSEVTTSSATAAATARAASAAHTQHVQHAQAGAALPFAGSSPGQQSQIASNVNAWLQASSSEDESEDPRGDNPASLMLNLLAPGVPPDILHCLSLSNPTSSDMSTQVARGSGGSAGGQGVAGAQSALASPNPVFSRSRSDADTLLRKTHVPHASHGSTNAHMPRSAVNGTLPPALGRHSQTFVRSSAGASVPVPPPLPPTCAEVHQDLPPSQRMPSESYLEEASSQAHAVVSALHAAFSSLERVVLQVIRRTAEEQRVAAPLLHHAGGKQASLPSGAGMHGGYAWSPWTAPGASLGAPGPAQLSGSLGSGPGFSGGPFAQARGWPGALPPVAPGGDADFQRMASAPHPHSHHMGAPPVSGSCLLNPLSHSHSMLPEREYSLPFSAAKSHLPQPLLQHSHSAQAPQQWQPLTSEFSLASNGYAPQPPAQTPPPLPPHPPQHHHHRPHSHPSHRLQSAESMHLPPPGPPLDLLPRLPSDNTGGLANAFAEHLLRAFSSGHAAEPTMLSCQLSHSASHGLGFDSPASHMHVHAGEWQQGPHASTLVFPRCEVCAVRSNSAKSLTAHLESKGHQRKIMLQAVLICEAALGGPATPPQGGSSTAVLPTNTNTSSPVQPTVQKANSGGGKEEGSATLLQYRMQLPDVRVADEATSKDVLGLLFQLVQMQIRKAEKFRESLPRAHKRCLAGMKEVAWAVGKPGQAKLVLIAPNIQIPCADSILLTQVRDLVSKCRDVGVPVIMGPSRKQLGMAFRTSEGSKSTFKLMSAVALLDVSGAQQQWRDIMARFATLPLAADVEDPPEAALSQPVPEAAIASMHAHSHASAPMAEAGIPLTPHSAFAQASVGTGVSASGHHVRPAAAVVAPEKRGMVPLAAAVVDRLGWGGRDGSPLQGRKTVKSFHEILERASVLLAQVVSLGSRLSSSGARLQSL